MAFSTKEVLDAMSADAGLSLADLRVDGGAAANDWLMQLQADVPIRRPDVIETTALGAAGLAGLGEKPRLSCSAGGAEHLKVGNDVP
ncbi:MAG: FGGY-family carbohydrate kinase [Gemmatimonadales bacterium]|nr:FGGY-family carbohydrate kinase [Gemmatimonadales bacterium]